MPNIPIVMSYVHVHIHVHTCAHRLFSDAFPHMYIYPHWSTNACSWCLQVDPWGFHRLQEHLLFAQRTVCSFKERRLIQNCFIYFIMLWNFCIVVHFVLCVSQRFGLQFFLPPWLLTPWRAFRSHTWHRSSKPSRRTWQLSSVDGLAKWWFQSTALSGSLQGLICFCFLLGLFCFLSVVFLSK